MKKISSKRQAQIRVYNRVKSELEKELKERGEWKCFFSGTPIPEEYTWKEVAWHHLKGRDGDLMTDKKFIRPVANLYHTGDQGYHTHPITDENDINGGLKNLWWWNGFMERLKALDYDLWYSHWLKENGNGISA